VLSKLLLELSQDKIVIDNNSVYWRDSVAVAALHEQLYLLVSALPLYPRDPTTLYYDQTKYPSKMIIESLKSKYGPHGDEKYRPPTRLRIDVLGEYKPRNLVELNQIIEELQRRLDARAYAPNWERDFVRIKQNATCVEGDRAYFKGLAQSALDENRVQVSLMAKSLLSREENALIAFGICISASETMNPYRGSGGRGFDRTEERLVSSYA
jgi:hypothetical protein